MKQVDYIIEIQTQYVKRMVVWEQVIHSLFFRLLFMTAKQKKKKKKETVATWSF